ncbi:MAG: hypothetical protein KGL40_11415 [Rhodocyclaceae bacterium]|nr:hypothetical protein [Rhodocyclaceae bacterium]
MSAARFSGQINAFLEGALHYGVSSLGADASSIQLEAVTREEGRTQPPTSKLKPGSQAALMSRDKQEHLLVSLGVCGFDYRLVLLFQIEDKAATRDFFGSTEAIQDRLGEFTNLVCGSLNRSLQRAYPSTGMSTPFSMSGACFDQLQILRPDLRVTLNFLLNADVRLRIAYALSLGRTFGFVENPPAEEESVGELELF